ncbi:MAG: DMT family transporter [Rhodospirillaceae bacterium]
MKLGISRSQLGIFLALGSAVCFALANTFARLAYDGGTTPFTLTVSRFYLPAIVLIAILVITRQSCILDKRSAFGSVFLGVVTVIYTLALLTAIERLPVPIAILIFYLFPILTAFILGAVGWSRISKIEVIGALVAFVGLALALGIEFDELDGMGMILAAAAAIGLATVSAISNQIMGGQDPRRATLYMCSTGIVIMTALALIRSEFTLPETPSGWTGFALTNVLYAIAMISFFYAISYAGAGATTFFSNLEPLVVTGAAFVFLDQSLAPLQLAGVAIVVSALIYVGKSKSGVGH